MNVRTRGVSFETGCNSRAFRRGYSDKTQGLPPRDDQGPKWSLLYETGRQTVAYAQGRGDTVHKVSATKKLDPNVREAISIQAAKMLAETSGDHLTKLGALFFLGEKGVVA